MLMLVSNLQIFLLLVVNSVFASYYYSEYDGIDETWKSQVFAFPNPWLISGRNCARNSKHVCLFKYEYSVRQGEERDTSMEFDTLLFGALVRPNFRKYNFYSLFPEHYGTGPCCSFQKQVYKKFGSSYGVGPRDYWANLTNFNSQGKQLNWILVNYRPHVCLNVIQSVGYGEGVFVYHGNYELDYPMAIPLRNAYEYYVIPDEGALEHFLSYDWLKERLICRDQPWICEEETFSGSEPHDQTEFRRKLKNHEVQIPIRRHNCSSFSRS
ncbi:uncharacterized protein LOC134844532 [Symsagittifera roscoffensis]|uniref:uncharacterized protein LOC134844532 n=1 Tax=Symsagittifera roscoffensis TaxID=84072 RepID=UPI00307C75A7